MCGRRRPRNKLLTVHCQFGWLRSCFSLRLRRQTAGPEEAHGSGLNLIAAVIAASLNSEVAQSPVRLIGITLIAHLCKAIYSTAKYDPISEFLNNAGSTRLLRAHCKAARNLLEN